MKGGEKERERLAVIKICLLSLSEHKRREQLQSVKLTQTNGVSTRGAKSPYLQSGVEE